jgi:hypothetical protein
MKEAWQVKEDPAQTLAHVSSCRGGGPPPWLVDGFIISNFDKNPEAKLIKATDTNSYNVSDLAEVQPSADSPSSSCKAAPVKEKAATGTSSTACHDNDILVDPEPAGESPLVACPPERRTALMNAIRKGQEIKESDGTPEQRITKLKEFLAEARASVKHVPLVEDTPGPQGDEVAALLRPPSSRAGDRAAGRRSHPTAEARTGSGARRSTGAGPSVPALALKPSASSSGCSRWKSTEYHVLEERRRWVCENLKPKREVFGGRHPPHHKTKTWSVKDDAWAQDWGADEDVKWVNPPFTDADIQRALDKIFTDQALAVMIVPIWDTKPWWKPLTQWALRGVEIPNDGPLYANAKGKPLPQRFWRTAAFLIDGAMPRVKDETEALLTEVQDVSKRTEEVLAAAIQARSTAAPGQEEWGELAEVAKILLDVLKELHPEFFTGSPARSPPKRGEFGEFKIELKPGTVPKKARYFRQGLGEKAEGCKALLMDFLRRGWIRRCQSAWASPGFVVPKPLKPGDLKRRWRFVVDYRYLNQHTVKDAYPTPFIDDLLESMKDANIFSILDMKTGYHQLPVHPDSQATTAFTTQYGTFQYRVLPMGLCNAGACFQRMMDTVFQDESAAKAYMDDVLCGSCGKTDWQKFFVHFADLDRVVTTLERHRLYGSPEKDHFFVRACQFCGHVLRDGTRVPAPGKVDAIAKWPRATSVEGLRAFLGVTGHYAPYIQGYQELATPLSDILRKPKTGALRFKSKYPTKYIPIGPLTLTPEEELAWDRLREAMAKSVMLYLVDPDQPFRIQADASDHAVGGVLEQRVPDDSGEVDWRPVAFYSKKLTGGPNEGQRHWVIREKETYAVLACLLRWESWIGNREVTVMSDHEALKHWHEEVWNTPAGPAGRRARWHEVFSRFNLIILYQAGKDATVPDAMTRWAYPAGLSQECSKHGSLADKQEVQAQRAQEIADEDEELRFRWSDLALLTDVDDLVDDPSELAMNALLDDLKKEDGDLESDLEYPTILAMVEDDQGTPVMTLPGETVTGTSWETHYKRDPELFPVYRKVVINQEAEPGLLWRQGRLWKDDRIVVPRHLEGNVVWDAHQLLHKGNRATAPIVKRRFAIPEDRIQRLVAQAREGCEICQMLSPPNTKGQGGLSLYRVPEQIMQAVVIDMVSLPAVTWEERTFDSAIVIADRLSGYIVAIPHTKKGATGPEIAKLYLKEVVPRFGLPATVTTAWDAPLVSRFWRSLCALAGINHRTVQAFNPRANGRAERAVAQVIQALRTTTRKLKRANWVEILPMAAYLLNSSPGDAGYSPYEIVHGREPVLLGEQQPLRDPNRDIAADNFFQRQLKLQERVRSALLRRHAAVERRDRESRPAVTEVYAPGDRVWWRWSAVESRKGDANKLAPRWHGPCLIRKVVAAEQYTIQYTERGATKDVSVEELKRCHPPFKGEALPLYATSIPKVTALLGKPGPIILSHLLKL